ncbi:MAG TPA: winged helix-turn-helix domain-containing protein [Ktedonobacterales bacterium]|nr:winged helix-turn-helix domain-containing protein [Ktedonobacterales bacterium]
MAESQPFGDMDAAEPSMPDLPPILHVSTARQFKAIADPTRSKILGIIQTRPATAKQIADRLNEAPGTIGHHLQVLEKAGLAQIVARRIVHGIVAKYYTRTARIFQFAFSPEITGHTLLSPDILDVAHQESIEATSAYGDDAICNAAFPHVRISVARAEAYQKRLEDLLDDLLAEPVDPNGRVYGIAFDMFLAPPYLQDSSSAPAASPTRDSHLADGKKHRRTE